MTRSTPKDDSIRSLMCAECEQKTSHAQCHFLEWWECQQTWFDVMGEFTCGTQRKLPAGRPAPAELAPAELRRLLCSACERETHHELDRAPARNRESGAFISLWECQEEIDANVICGELRELHRLGDEDPAPIARIFDAPTGHHELDQVELHSLNQAHQIITREAHRFDLHQEVDAAQLRGIIRRLARCLPNMTPELVKELAELTCKGAAR